MDPSDRLETWKEIAVYLQRDVRTVQRWEASEQLPVRRHQHKKRGSVSASRSEIDRWREQRRPAAVNSPRRVERGPWPAGLVIELVEGAAPPARFRLLGSQVREVQPQAGDDPRVMRFTVNVFVKA